MSAPRDHGGGIDTARAQYGGAREDWLDLSTGINPEPYPLGDLPPDCWTALPDRAAQDALTAAARRFWAVPEGMEILAAPGASALIAQAPRLFPGHRVDIPAPTYNEHAAAFRGHGWRLMPGAPLRVLVHPNNPNGRRWSAADLTGTAHVIDESFGDIAPEDSLLSRLRPNDILLKSFGKFWGLAGLRLGFAIGAPDKIAQLAEALGPWPVAGPALAIGTRALSDPDWAAATRARLHQDAARLDALLEAYGARPIGGTALFRLYDTEDASAWQARLARAHIWSRIFPYSPRWLRLGLPPQSRWAQLEAAL